MMRVLLWVLLVLLILLFFPVIVSTDYEEQLVVKLRFFVLIPIKILPKSDKPPGKLLTWLYEQKDKRKEKKNASSPQSAKEEAGTLSKLFAENGASGALSMLARIISLSKSALGGILRGAILLRFRFFMRVGGEDAQKTAVNYGRMCAAVYPLLSAVFRTFMFYRKDLDIAPDFCSEETTASLNALLLLFPGLVLWQVIKAFSGIIFGIIRDRVRDNLNNIKISQKDGA